MTTPLFDEDEVRAWLPLAPGAVEARLRRHLQDRRDRSLRRLCVQADELRAEEARSRVGSASFVGALAEEGPEWLSGLVLRMVALQAQPRDHVSPDHDARRRLSRVQETLAQTLRVGVDQILALAVSVGVEPRSPRRSTDYRFEQGSADLAALIALASQVSGQAPSGNVVLSASLVQVGGSWVVGSIQGRTLRAKRAAVRLERPDAVLRVGPGTPGAAPEELLGADPGEVLDLVLGAAWREAALCRLDDPLRRDLDDAWRHFCANRPEAALESYRELDLRVWRSRDIHVMYHVAQTTGTCLARLGEAEQALEQLELAADLLSAIEGRDPDPDSLRLGRYQRYELEAFASSINHISLRFGASIEQMEAALDRLGARPQLDDPRWRLAIVAVAGTLARTHRATGQLARAAHLYEAHCIDAGLDNERARSLGDYADTLRRAGRLDAAEGFLVLADKALQEIEAGPYRKGSADYLVLHRARLLLAVGDRAGAAALATPVVEEWPESRERDARYHGMAAVRVEALHQDRPEEAERELLANLREATAPLLLWVASIPTLRWLAEGWSVADDLVEALRRNWATVEFDLNELEAARKALIADMAPRAARLLADRCTH